MTTTIPKQTEELRIITTPPTVADAQLLTQMAIADAASGAVKGYLLLQQFDNPPTLAQLRRKHPVDSEEYHLVIQFLVSCERTGTFVKHGLLSEALVMDLYDVKGAWRLSEKVIKGSRKESGEPRLGENFELLASRAS